MTRAAATLAGADWLQSAPLKRVLAALSDVDRETRIVGGTVRNALLGLPVTDMDLATELLPDDVMARAKHAGLAAYPTGIAHGTITVVADGAPFEVTTLRRDVETDGRHAVVAFTRDWREDAMRRDFTINALSARADGTLFDYTGGITDIAEGRVRFIGVAGDRIREDYLRVLRFFRFSAAYARGPLDGDGLDACIALKDGIAQLSAERIGAEMGKLIMTPKAADVARVMSATGILFAACGLAGFPQRLTRLQEIETSLGESPDRITRLAALLVDGRPSVDLLAARLRLSNADAAALAHIADGCSGCEREASEAALKAALYRCGSATGARSLRLSWARSCDPTNDAVWLGKCAFAAHWTPPRKPFSGADILVLGVAGGPEVGRILKAFEDWWIDAGFPEDRALLAGKLAALARKS